jgi:Polysaccharide deacetylase
MRPAGDEARASAARGRAFVRALRDGGWTDGAPAWFDVPLRRRVARRAALRLPVALLSRARSPRAARVAADAAFWAGVRAEATPAEWERLTRVGFVALVYHRLAGDGKPGQERLDVSPRRFATHLRLLRLLRFDVLTAGDAVDVVAGTGPRPRRGVVVTVDDGLRDCLEPLVAAAASAPILFVPTRELGGPAHWLDGEPTMSWGDVRSLADAGVTIGAHARHHVRLTQLDDATLAEELAGCLGDVRAEVPQARPLLAYPNGAHDARVCGAAREAGFEAAFTTEKGKNGAGSEAFRLRRVSVYGYDGSLAFLWKAATGEGVPRLVERVRRREPRFAPST